MEALRDFTKFTGVAPCHRSLLWPMTTIFDKSQRDYLWTEDKTGLTDSPNNDLDILKNIKMVSKLDRQEEHNYLTDINLQMEIAIFFGRLRKSEFFVFPSLGQLLPFNFFDKKHCFCTFFVLVWLDRKRSFEHFFKHNASFFQNLKKC